MSASSDRAAEVCQFVVEQIVDNPEQVKVTVGQSDSGSTRLDVTVGEGDMGRVIGKRGRVARAIRTVVRAAGAETDAREIEVEFVD